MIRVRRLDARRGLACAGAVLAALGLALALLAGLGVPPQAAHAAEEVDRTGTWFFDDFGIAELHARGVDGTGVTVALFDSAINTDAPSLRGANIVTRTSAVCGGWDGVREDEDADHATKMAELIVGTGEGTGERWDQQGVRGLAPGATLLHYAVIDEHPRGCREVDLAASVADALEQGARILSFSIGGYGYREVVDAFLPALKAGAIIDVAVPNANASSADEIAAANGVVSIENVDATGQPDGMSVITDTLDFVGAGVSVRGSNSRTGYATFETYLGTSPATAWSSAVFALAQSAWPEATPNQLLQSAIRSTSNGWEPLTRTDAEGFGLLSPQNLAVIDPTQFPDANPLLTDQPSASGRAAYPTYEQVMGEGATPEPLPVVTAEIPIGSSVPKSEPTLRPVPSAATEGMGEDAPPWTPHGGALSWVAAATATAALVGGGLIVVLARRPRTRPAAMDPMDGWAPSHVPPPPPGLRPAPMAPIRGVPPVGWAHVGPAPMPPARPAGDFSGAPAARPPIPPAMWVRVAAPARPPAPPSWVSGELGARRDPPAPRHPRRPAPAWGLEGPPERRWPTRIAPVDPHRRARAASERAAATGAGRAVRAVRGAQGSGANPMEGAARADGSDRAVGGARVERTSLLSGEDSRRRRREESNSVTELVARIRAERERGRGEPGRG